jgi:hypothetical protein
MGRRNSQSRPARSTSQNYVYTNRTLLIPRRAGYFSPSTLSRSSLVTSGSGCGRGRRICGLGL